jgi:hypothetical protein
MFYLNWLEPILRSTRMLHGEATDLSAVRLSVMQHFNPKPCQHYLQDKLRHGFRSNEIRQVPGSVFDTAADGTGLFVSLSMLWATMKIIYSCEYLALPNQSPFAQSVQSPIR